MLRGDARNSLIREMSNLAHFIITIIIIITIIAPKSSIFDAQTIALTHTTRLDWMVIALRRSPKRNDNVRAIVAHF